MPTKTFRLAALPFLFALWACGHHPTPPRPPTPPTPAPPARLQTQGRFFTLDGQPYAFKLFSDCCDDPFTPNVDEGVASGGFLPIPELIDQYATAPPEWRRNAVEMRIGPSHWDPNWPNPYGIPDGLAILPYAKDRCTYYNSKGFRCYVVVNDAWVLASRPDLNLWGEDCSVMRSAPPDHWIEWAKSVATTFKDLSVVYSLDNEGFRCRPNQSWEDGLVSAIRSVDPNVVIGSSHWPDAGIIPNEGRILYDFVSIQDTVQLPYALSVPVVMVETDGGFHPESHFRSLESRAQPGVYVGRWRGPESLNQWHYMMGIGPDPGPDCTAPPVGKMGVKQLQRRVADATPSVCDRDWCNANGSPGRNCCPYAPEGSGSLGRLVCESEQGWPYSWFADDQPCDQVPLEHSKCWQTANPLQGDFGDMPGGTKVRVCAKNGVCGEFVWP